MSRDTRPEYLIPSTLEFHTNFVLHGISGEISVTLRRKSKMVMGPRCRHYPANKKSRKALDLSCSPQSTMIHYSRASLRLQT